MNTPEQEEYVEPQWLTERRAEALRYLGEKYLLHPVNYVKKIKHKQRK